MSGLVSFAARAAAFSIVVQPLLASAQPAPEDDAVIVTAARFPERRLSAPVGMTVITAEDIAAESARSLPELLARLGGLHVRDNSGNPDLQVDLRGFGVTGDQNTLVLVDGIRLNENDLSTTRLSAIPLQSIERIEILRGSGAVLYGGGASGGTINVITKGPQPGRRDAAGLFGIGSYATGDARFSANLAGERFGAFVSGSHLESDNYRLNNRVRQDNVAGDVRYAGEEGSVALKLGSDVQRLQLPGVRDENQIASDPRGTATPGDWSTREGNRLTLLARRGFGNVDLAGDLGYRDQLATAYFRSFASYNEARLHGLTLSPRLRWSGVASGIASTLVAGIDLNTWDFDRRFSADPASIGTPFATTKASQKSSALYLQLNAQVLRAAKLALGWRTQRVADELVQTGFFASSQRHSRSPRAGEIGLQVVLAPRWTAFGRLGTSFRVATVDENGFTASGGLIEPQTARHRDFGLEYRNGGLQVRASLYDINLDNEIYFSPLVVPFGANTNLSPTRRSGAEVFARAPVTRDFDLSGSIVLQSAKFKYGTYGGVDVAGKDVPLVPRALVSLRAAWSLPGRSQLVAALRYVGRQRYDNDQANAFARLMPAYLLADLKLSRTLGEWTLSATVNNILDKRYYSYGIVNSFACATPVCAYPQAGRTIFASVERPFR